MIKIWCQYFVGSWSVSMRVIFPFSGRWNGIVRDSNLPTVREVFLPLFSSPPHPPPPPARSHLLLFVTDPAQPRGGVSPAVIPDPTFTANVLWNSKKKNMKWKNETSLSNPLRSIHFQCALPPRWRRKQVHTLDELPGHHWAKKRQTPFTLTFTPPITSELSLHLYEFTSLKHFWAVQGSPRT